MTNILIYGAGAIGSYVGYILSNDPDKKTVENVGLLGRASHIEKIKKSGLLIKFPSEERNVRFKHCFTDLSEIERSKFRPEVIIITVKTYSLEAVSQQLKDSGLLDGHLKDSKIVLLMNGMGNRESLMAAGICQTQILEGITSLGVVFSGDGIIEPKGFGKTSIEQLPEQRGLKDETMKFLIDRFHEKGLELEFTKDFKRLQYNKLFANCIINPITALVERENGVILSGTLGETIKNIVKELVNVSRAEGLEVDEQHVFDAVRLIAEKTSRNTSSMLQDRRSNRNTEINAINGYIIRLGKKHNIPTPVNQALFELISSLKETGTDQP